MPIFSPVTCVFFRFSQTIFQHAVLKVVVVRARPMNIQRPLPTPVQTCRPWVMVAIPPVRLPVTVQIAFPSALGTPVMITKVAFIGHFYSRPPVYPSPGSTRRVEQVLYVFFLFYADLLYGRGIYRSTAETRTSRPRPVDRRIMTN